MASIRFKFRASSVSGKQGTLFIQVIHRRVARQVSTQYKLYPGEWDPAGQSVTVPKDTLPDRSRYLHAVQEALQQDASRLQLIILALDHSRKEYQAEDVIRHFLRKEQSDEFTIFADHLFLYAQPACHLQSGSGTGAHPSNPSLCPCLYRHCQDRDQRSHGAFHPTHHIHLPQVLREYPC